MVRVKSRSALGKANVDLAGIRVLDSVVKGLLRYPVEVGGVGSRDMGQILTLEMAAYP